ncbi:MAG: Outer membrane protein assembly factor BamA [Chlamydiia bacterium]|nr:Outer membrane protein assembly factor BamA [Chlamydiia bacterium]
MKKFIVPFLLSFCMILFADQGVSDTFENLNVQEITVDVKNASPSNQQDADAKVLLEMRLKPGDKFDQIEFDKDLKELADKYQIVDPVISKKDGKLFIHLNVTLRPKIVKFVVEGSNYSSKKILAKGELEAPMEYNRGKFYQSITDIRDFLIKKGYFKADVTYKIEETPGTGEAVAHIYIDQGPLGHIHNIEFVGFTKKEKSAVYSMIKSSKFNILTNWFTGSGVMREADVERDAQIITHYIQNEGYIDAKVDLEIDESVKDKLTLKISLNRGELYHVGAIEVTGNTLESKKDIDNALAIKKGDTFSTEKVQITQEKIRSLYTDKGYLDTNVNYELVPAKGHTFNIIYNVEESDKYKVGLIHVSGNKRTNNNVIYNNIRITPGETFDSSKMKETQQKLQSTGYFKHVNVYAVKSDQKEKANSQYRDVVVEVEENRTASFHLSAGANSTANIFGELSFRENNFDITGFKNVWQDGLKSFRGGGEFMDVRATVAQKEQSGTVSWINPYINDSLWRFGLDVQGKRNATIADYDLYSMGGAFSLTYPVNQFFSAGFKGRIKNSIIRLNNVDAVIEQKQEKNGGIVTGGGIVCNYNSTNNPFVPHNGLKSSLEGEFANLIRDNIHIRDFPFFKFNYLNSYYVPLWDTATLKFRGDVGFIQPLWGGLSEDFPLTEKFFLGGVATVRGYAPGQIGPYFDNELGDPTGGISSQLFSVEVLQKVIQPLDVFAFFDTGAISHTPFDVTSKYYMSVGAGVRLHIGQPLPFILGYGYPINPDDIQDAGGNNPQEQRVFFSMAGQF